MGLNNTYNAKVLYYNYGITDRRSVGDAIPTYLSSILTQFDFASLDELYAFIDTIAHQIEYYFLGGIIQTYTVNDLITGWNSPLISKLQFQPDSNLFDSYYFKTGDTIVYNKNI
jgi:hypothetical protein